MSILGQVAALLLFVTYALAVIVDASTFAATGYDFIVVGGGTAGVTVGVRLSENPIFTVGIIEAGNYNPDDPLINIPMGCIYGGTWGNPDYDWRFTSTPQPTLANRSLAIARGKALGGSSAINLMGFVRAPAVEYDQIGELGNEGWSWNQILPYFMKTENISAASPALQNATHATYDPAYHGTSGPIHSSFSNWYSTAIPPFFDVLQYSLGLPAVLDGEAGNEAKVFNPTLSIDQETGTRSYAASAYYQPNSERPNLHVLLNSQVTKVDLSSEPDQWGNLAARGVTYVSGGTTHFVKAKKEVIVSAGSVQSPQILELSGIGNKTLLESLGIPSKVNLPSVGENYQDHLSIEISFQIPSDIETWLVFFNPTENATVYAQYEGNRTGPFAASIMSGGLMSAHEFVNASTLAAWVTQLDQEFYATNPTPGEKALYEINRARMNYSSDEVVLELYATPSYTGPAPLANASYISLTALPIHPFSRGSIHVTSSNPLTYPAININALSYTIDMNLFVAAAKLLRTIAYTAPLKSLIVADSFPDPSDQSDAQWEAFIQQFAADAFHPCCTNAMLPEEMGGVVDNKLMVYGTSNIRVVDVSILPLELATHLQGTAYAIAEQAADFIKEAWA